MKNAYQWFNRIRGLVVIQWLKCNYRKKEKKKKRNTHTHTLKDFFRWIEYLRYDIRMHVSFPHLFMHDYPSPFFWWFCFACKIDFEEVKSKWLLFFFFFLEEMEMKIRSDHTSPINDSTSTIENQNDAQQRTHSSRTVLTEIIS